MAPLEGRSLDLDTVMAGEVVAKNLTWDPAYQQSLTQLSVYFAHLEVSSLSCQERLICEVTADPLTFFPISQIFLKELRLVNGPVTMTDDSLMWRYMTAARQGFTSHTDSCVPAYSSCHLPADSFLNMPVLKVWQYISSKVKLEFI
nr:uncharacterized protein LOC128690241 [Cherax quadricarinatus]